MTVKFHKHCTLCGRRISDGLKVCARCCDLAAEREVDVITMRIGNTTLRGDREAVLREVGRL
jgi:predicted nucleic acid-binding Zn ribbon protein